MNQLKKQLLCTALLVSASPLLATTSKIVPRSQSFNAARQIVGWNNPEWGINRLPQDSCYTSFNLIFEYTRTFRSRALTECLFGSDVVCGPCDDSAIKISGSAVADRNGATDWLADYFGLPRDFQSTVSFKPTISNFILDFSFYVGLDSWAPGLYFRIHGPFVHTKWNMNAEECIAQAGTLGYFQGYFSSEVVPVENLNKSFLAYTNGCTPTINNNYDLYNEESCLAGTLSIPGFGYAMCTPLGDITWQPLCCSRISNDCDCSGLSLNGFGELRFVLGYNFVNDPDGNHHLGLGIYAAAPTGTRIGDDGCCGQYLFEPIVGNGHHWELGAQVTGHHIWWRNEDDTKSLGLYVEANVTHLFGTCQTRCFDLCSAGSNSRYMLAQRLTSNADSFPGLNARLNATQFNPLGLEFGNEYAPVANLTRRNVTSTIGAQGDIAFSFAYQSSNFQWDIGYDFWGRSCEKLCVKDDCCYDQSLDNWALKGDQRVYGFVTAPGALDPISIAVKLPVSDSQASIHTGSNMRNGVDYTGANPLQPQNLYTDNPQFIASFVGILPVIPMAIYISNPALLLSECDLNVTGTRGISHKLFTHFNWAWADREDTKWTPYMGIGAEVEFGSHHDTCCDTSCYYPSTTCSTVQSCCENCAISQWGIWFKVGSSYN